MNRLPGLALRTAPILLVGVLLVVLVSRLEPIWIIGVAAGLLLFLTTFINLELTLHLIIIAMLRSPELSLGQVGGANPGGVGHDSLTIRLEDLLLMFMGFGWLARVAIYKEFVGWERSPINLPLGLWVGICVISTIMGYVKGYVGPAIGFFFNLKLIEYYFVYYMAIQVVADHPDVLKRLMTTFFVTSLSVCLYGVSQLPIATRVTAPFEGEGGEPNTYGGYLLIIVGVTLGLLFHVQGLGRKLGFMAMMALTLFNLAYTQSRASWVGMVPLFVTFLIIHPRRIVAVYGLLGLGALVYFFFPSGAIEIVSQRVAGTFEDPLAAHETLFGFGVDTSTAVRIRGWRTAFEYWLADPLLGRGVTGFEMDAVYPRNLAETGLAGTTVFLWLIGRIFRLAYQSFKHCRDHPTYAGLALGYLCALAGIMGHGVGTSSFTIVRIMEPFWFMTAVSMSLPKLYDMEMKQAAPEETTPQGTDDVAFAHGKA